MTKTQAALIARAEANPYRRVAVTCGYQASRPFGLREHNAAVTLREMGVLEFVESDATPLYKHGYGINGRVVTSIFRLTEAVKP